jgi:uncharacterized surface protein with fasciclin (FAS1) repeats
MKKILIIFSICAVTIGFLACKETNIDVHFKDIEENSIYDYIIQNQETYSKFLQILEVGGLDKTLSAYNPEGEGYTLFLPNNAAIDSFLLISSYASFEEMLADRDFIWYFSRYHVISEKYNANDFPFGAFADLTLTEDYLAVSFVNETDTSYYKINNQAPVIETNLEMSNGFIHLIKVALTPVTTTTYGWLMNHSGYTIFRDAVEATGLNNLLNINPKVTETVLPFTLFLEHDTTFHKAGIHTFSDLVDEISPDRADFNNPLNPLYNFVAYHVVTESYFLPNFMQNSNGDRLSTNYSTYSDIPLHVDGRTNDIKINVGKQMFDTIIHDVGDTTFINFVGFDYDASNIVTQSGVIHIIDQVLKQQNPSRAELYIEIMDRPLFDLFNDKPGTYLIEDSLSLNSINYSGADLLYVLMDNAVAPGALWSDDYVQIDGDFTLSYTTNKIVQGNYTVYIQADFLNTENAVVEVFIDGKPIGGTVDLANDPLVGATADAPFGQKELGTVNFVKYGSHKITIRTLIPGNFSWDYIRFEPL